MSWSTVCMSFFIIILFIYYYCSNRNVEVNAQGNPTLQNFAFIWFVISQWTFSSFKGFSTCRWLSLWTWKSIQSTLAQVTRHPRGKPCLNLWSRHPWPQTVMLAVLLPVNLIPVLPLTVWKALACWRRSFVCGLLIRLQRKWREQL